MTTASTLATISSLLRAISSVSGVGGVAGVAVGTLLNFGADLIDKGEEGAAELESLNVQVQTMVTENRGPTDDELNALKARSDAAHAAIQGTDSGSPT